jgi:phytoene dehydrogenase-like protein
VDTTDGRRIAARRAVVSSAHLAGLADLLLGHEPSEDLLRARDTWRPGLSLFAVHAALRRDLTFPTAAGPLASVAGGLGSAEGLRAQLAAFADGKPDARDPWLLVVASTVADPGRAPEGGGTLKLLTIAPHDRADGRAWDDTGDDYAAELMDLVLTRTGLPRGEVLSVVAETPTGLAARNPHNVGGSCHGGEFVNGDGAVLPGWSSHRSGVPGLYLTGSTTHPGGSVSGRPGRNAARVVLDDLGVGAGAVMGAL